MLQPTLHSVMTEAEYEAAREQVRATYGDSNIEAAAKWEQALAGLFARSGWTQKKLAEKEGKSEAWVTRQLKFGQFLDFLPTGNNPETVPNDFTERSFRKLWSETDQRETNDRIRFKQVVELIRGNTRIGKSTATKGHAKLIREHFADAKWYPLAEVAEKINETEPETLKRLQNTKKLGSIDFETRLRGRDQHTECRIFPRQKTVSVAELAEKLSPLIKKLKEEGKKSMATMVPANVAMLADLLQRLLDEWTE